jgi:nucleoside 2-deoxyribosyltransferase
MNDIFICYALERDFLNDLQFRLNEISLGAEDLGLTSYAHIRDEQNWQFHNEPIKLILNRSFKVIESSSIVFLDLTSKNHSKRTGLNIEAGYAKALKKRIVALYHESDRPNMTTDLAEFEISYSELSEIRAKVVELLQNIAR